MHSNSPTPSGMFFGAGTSIVFLLAGMVPEVPPIAQWICLLLSASASILTIKKNSQ